VAQCGYFGVSHQFEWVFVDEIGHHAFAGRWRIRVPCRCGGFGGAGSGDSVDEALESVDSGLDTAADSIDKVPL